MKNIVIAGAVITGILGALYIYLYLDTPSDKNMDVITGQEIRVQDSIKEDTSETQTGGKLKADTFTGTLETVDTGCFVDAECFVVVDGKHVTVLTGMRLGEPQEVGSVVGTDDGIGGLEAFIGQEVEVYAQDNSDGTYTLYGSEGFYVKVLK